MNTRRTRVVTQAGTSAVKPGATASDDGEARVRRAAGFRKPYAEREGELSLRSAAAR